MNHATTSMPYETSSSLNCEMKSLRVAWVQRLILLAMVMWITYMVTGFRLPHHPILLSDGNAGSSIRQLIFGGTGLMVAGCLYLTRMIGAAFVIRFPYVLLCALLFVSAAWSDQPALTIRRAIIFACGLLAIIALVHANHRPVRYMMRMTIFGGGLMAVLSLVSYVLLPTTCSVNPARPGLAGIAVHPNTLAPFLSIGLMMSLGFTPNSIREKWIFRASQLFSAIALILTVSVTTLLTTLVGVILYLFLSSSSYRRGLFQLFAMVCLLLVALLGLKAIKSGVFDAIGRDESLSGRDELWQSISYEIMKEPIVGNGYGAFWTEGKGREIVKTWNPRQSHHAYLDVLLDLGLFGLGAILFLFPIRLIFVWLHFHGLAGSKYRKASSAMMATAFSYLIVYAFSQSYLLRFDSYPFLILIWITLLMSNRDTNRMDQEFFTVNQQDTVTENKPIEL